MNEHSGVIKNTVSAKNQVNENIYYLGDSGLKVMILGNSITLHHPKADIGWFGSWGMAASSAENDYVHRLYSAVSDRFGKTQFCIVQASDWELNFDDVNQTEAYKDAKDFAPDVIVFRLGENIHPDERPIDGLYQGIKNLISYFGTDKTRVIFTTRFMPDEKVDEVIRRFANDNGYPIAELGDMGSDYAMLAFDKFEHGGVASHPGDAGMKNIADRILNIF